MTMARENDLAMPTDLAILFKGLVTADGVMRQLDPGFDLPTEDAHDALTLSGLPTAAALGSEPAKRFDLLILRRQVADLDGGGRAVRDSKDPAGGFLLFTAAEWVAFTAGVRAGEFD